jgi:hypothetical protein
MARAVAERYAQALADRAASHANDLASAVVSAYPPEYDPTRFVGRADRAERAAGAAAGVPGGPGRRPGAPLGGTGDLAGITDPPPIE